jgi:hypothetical protein
MTNDNLSIKKNQRLFAWSNIALKVEIKILFLILWVLTFSYLLFIGYTTSDDVQIARQSFSESFSNALNGGRLTWIIAIPSTLLSETQGDTWYTKLLRFIWVAALFHATYLLLRRFFSIEASLYICTFPIIFFVNDLDHHAFSSYPGLAVYGFVCVFYAIHFFNQFLESDKRFYLAISCWLFSLSFVTELFPTLLIFLLIYPYLGIKKRISNFWVHLLITIIFLLCYLKFQSFSPAYPIKLGWDALRTWFIYSYSQIYHALQINSNLHRELSIVFAVKIIISLVILYLLLSSFSKSKLADFAQKHSLNGKLIFWWLLLSIWINIPVAITLNYQGWVKVGSQAYLYSALSNFCFSIAIGIVLLYLFEKWHLKKWVLYIFILSLSIIYGFNQIKSHANYQQQMYSHIRWVYMDQLAQKKYFLSDICYIAPWLFDLNGIIGIRTAEYWNQYLWDRWGIKTNITRDKIDSLCRDSEILMDPRKKP